LISKDIRNWLTFAKKTIRGVLQVNFLFQLCIKGCQNTPKQIFWNAFS